MKKLIIPILIISAALFGCDFSSQPKDDKTPKPDIVKVDTTKHLIDVVLENPAMDKKVNDITVAKRKRPGEPPPVITHNGCILLDFDGHNLSGTVWNVSGDIPCDSSGLTEEQQQLVLDTVRSHYSVFPTITVTTDEAVFNTYPQNKRRRCIITRSNEWYGNSVGGVAYLNSFGWFDDSPCFVFTALLGYSLKNVSDESSHECGHTLGLRHQSIWENGVKISEYNWGNAPGEIGWAPIMGSSLTAVHPMWWIGLNSLGVMQNDTTVVFTTLRN